jgi:hypothetical protein
MCLNSPGGSFQEALRIIEYFLNESDNGYGTVVDAGQECVSACALIFMFGYAYEGHSFYSTDRRLHVKGKLGFHTPYVTVSGEAFKADEVATQYRRGVQAIGRLLELDKNNFFPRPLLVEMLKTEPEQLLFADTVERAAAWDLELVGYKTPKVLTERMLEIACDHHQLREIDFAALSRDEKTGLPVTRAPDRSVSFRNGYRRVILPGFGDEEGFMCVVDLLRNSSGQIAMELFITDDMKDQRLSTEKSFRDLYQNNMPKRDFIGTLKPLWFVYPGKTRIVDIAAE